GTTASMKARLRTLAPGLTRRKASGPESAASKAVRQSLNRSRDSPSRAKRCGLRPRIERCMPKATAMANAEASANARPGAIARVSLSAARDRMRSADFTAPLHRVWRPEQQDRDEAQPGPLLLSWRGGPRPRRSKRPRQQWPAKPCVAPGPGFRDGGQRLL